MKTLRILTGIHAGIQVRLEPGRYRIGPDDDTDVCITDWDDDEGIIELDESGIVRVSRGDGGPRAADGAEASDGLDTSVVLIPDLVPFPFGNTVLCFCADDVPWPPDIELLASIYRDNPPDEAESPASGEATSPAPRGSRGLRAVAGVLALGGALLAASALLGWPRAAAHPAAAPSPAQLAAQVNAALAAAHLPALHAVPSGNLVEVDGFVANAAQDVAARGVLMKFDDGGVVRHYDVEQSDIASVEESLANDGVHVAWSSPGTLSVTGEVPSLASFRTRLEQIQADLDSNVQRIDVDVVQAADAVPSAAYTEMVAAGDTQYVETPDGVKHLFDGDAPGTDGPARLQETIEPHRAPSGIAGSIAQQP